jgi:AcrR family transcriptional regulator
MSRRVAPDERERRRLHVLEVAAREFALHGFDAANINTISEAAGFGKGTIYLYAASKEQLFLDVLEEIGIQTRAALDASLAGSAGEPLPVRLHAMVDAFTELAARHPDFIRLQASALFGVNRRFQAAAAALLRQSVSQLTESFASEQQQGAMRAVDPALLALLMLGVLQTFALLPGALGIEGPERSTSEISAFLVETLWRGLSPAGAEAVAAS